MQGSPSGGPARGRSSGRIRRSRSASAAMGSLSAFSHGRAIGRRSDPDGCARVGRCFRTRRGEPRKAPLSIPAIVATTPVVDPRYVPMSASLRPWFESPSLAHTRVRSSPPTRPGRSPSRTPRGRGSGCLSLGVGLAVWRLRVGSAVAGATIDGATADPERYGLEFVLTVIFVATGL